MLLSNLGCIYHCLRKEQTATLYFTKALHSFTCSHISQPQSVPKFSQDQSLAIVYNASIQQLSWGNPKLAACCFQEAAALYYTWPLLWLCLAECCILALEKGLLAKSLPKREDVKVMVIVEGNWRVFVPTRSLNPTVASAKLGLQGDDDAVEDMELLIPQEDGKWFVADKLYELSLNFAIQCLRTAICLVDQREAILAEAVTAAAAEEVKDNDGIKLKGSSQPFLLS
jgi:CCR4-NOT transcription complex subunit 10